MSPTIGISRMLKVVALYLMILDNIRFSSGFDLVSRILYYGFFDAISNDTVTFGLCHGRTLINSSSKVMGYVSSHEVFFFLQ